MERAIANISGKVRRAQLYGRPYLVAPMTMLVPGVLNGSMGPLYYPPENVANTLDAWNGMPLTLGHPSKAGQPVSARNPDTLNEFGLGFVFGSVFNSELSAEGWFDEELTRQKSKSVWTALTDNKPIELSTGLFTEVEQAPDGATHNARPYTHVVRTMRPDHLAILPDAKGACSTDDGCGVNNTATDNESFFKDCPRDDKGHCKTAGSAQERKLDTDTTASGSDKSMKCKCPDGSTITKLPADEESGAAGGRHFPARNEASTQPREKDMKDQLVTWLATNCSCWKGKQETLNKLDEPELQGMKDEAEKAVVNATLVTNLRTELETVKTQTSAPRLTVEEQATLNWATQERARQKAQLVERLLINVTDPAKRQAQGTKLMGKSEEELRDLIDLVGVHNTAQSPQFDFTKPIPHYAGAAGGPPTYNTEPDDPDDVIPVINIEYPDPRTRRQA